MPLEARRISSFGAGGGVSKHGRSGRLSDSRSENTMGSGGLYGFISSRCAEVTDCGPSSEVRKGRAQDT